MRPKSGKGLTPAISAVEALLKSQSLAQTLRPHMAKTIWAEIVGPQVAGVTQVESVRGNDTLVVRVKNGVWANELTLLKDDMLRRLNSALGGAVLADIHFKASGLSRGKKDPAKLPVSLPEAPAPEALAQIVLTEEARARVENAVQGIMEDELRSRIEATLTRVARTSAWKQSQGWQPCARCGALAPPAALPHSASDPHLCSLCRTAIRYY